MVSANRPTLMLQAIEAASDRFIMILIGFLMPPGFLHDCLATDPLYSCGPAPASGEENPGEENPRAGRKPFRRHRGTVYRDDRVHLRREVPAVPFALLRSHRAS